MTLTDFRTLGRSGLIVSPLALGTMTFGTPRWGSTDHDAAAVFGTYLEAGGNFIDTADVYAGGRSEELVGQFVAEHRVRDRVVLATKFGFSAERGNPHAGGNGRKHIHQALEGSLRRLKTEYIDLYWLHVWDMVTPVEEVLQTLGDLVRAGTIRYFGFSDMPAWYTTKAATLAHVHNVPGPIGMQLEYSLVARSLETEHLGAARDGGLGIVPWSPLAGGFLGGRYERASSGGQGRLSGPNPFGDSKFTERNWKTLDVLKTVAAQTGHAPAQVALAWLSAQPGVASILLGARTPEQLQSNLGSLEVQLTPQQLQALNAASVLDPAMPQGWFSEALKRGIFGGVSVEGWR
ncbi:aldo/keto reductase (plasmid) [Deinococcus sp. KNUC1210]|uniref:aldo/keto reductase n=1 Tax=Deinococcus sp. KNUC1210 TaxID=2917691 RepID=UPI001EF03E5B|nr:aldo/keto reductase [Deinococcus sp. KNUC1210]ULH17474.1 aldo/keto reductase [Deinococcus sp. KNUC1210]